MNKLIKIENLSKSFGDKTIIDKFNMEIYQGENIAILGYSGCGKTTFLRMMGGFEAYDSGTIKLNDEDVLNPSRDSIMVFQDFAQLFQWKTVLNNVSWPLLATKIVNEKNRAQKIAIQYLSDMGIVESDFSKYPTHISGGMKQRVVLARALALRPKILLLDEPFGALDEITRIKTQDITYSVCRKYKITTLLVTHSINEAFKMADRIIMFDGETPTVLSNTAQNQMKIEKFFGLR